MYNLPVMNKETHMRNRVVFGLFAVIFAFSFVVEMANAATINRDASNEEVYFLQTALRLKDHRVERMTKDDQFPIMANVVTNNEGHTQTIDFSRIKNVRKNRYKSFANVQLVDQHNRLGFKADGQPEGISVKNPSQRNRLIASFTITLMPNPEYDPASPIIIPEYVADGSWTIIDRWRKNKNRVFYVSAETASSTIGGFDRSDLIFQGDLLSASEQIWKVERIRHKQTYFEIRNIDRTDGENDFTVVGFNNKNASPTTEYVFENGELVSYDN